MLLKDFVITIFVKILVLSFLDTNELGTLGYTYEIKIILKYFVIYINP